MHGRHYIVELTDGERLQCYPRGKKSQCACGDMVDIERSADQGVITQVHPRSSSLYRSDRFRQKVIAANVTQAVVVVAAQPTFNEDLVMRCLIACEQQHIRAIIVLNKIDLREESARAGTRLRLYEILGYSVIPICAKSDVTPLKFYLRDHCSVVVGQSGMGKSTIVNALVPEAKARTADISTALDSGKHTTTSAHLYHLDKTSHLIDSPGLQSFGLIHVSQPELIDCIQEFRPFHGQCRFDDCRHTVEPDCAIIAAAGRGEIDARRWEIYRTLLAELDAKPPDWA